MLPFWVVASSTYRISRNIAPADAENPNAHRKSNTHRKHTPIHLKVHTVTTHTHTHTHTAASRLHSARVLVLTDGREVRPVMPLAPLETRSSGSSISGSGLV